MNKNTINREYGIDIAKIIACLFVPMIHFYNYIGFYEQPIFTKTMFISVLFFGLLMTCVPIFIVCTGFVSLVLAFVISRIVNGSIKRWKYHHDK